MASNLKVYQIWNDSAGTVGSQPESISTGQGTKEGISNDSLTQYTLEEVREHWEMKSCWIVLFDLVYDVTEFLFEHPGGTEIILEHAGVDSTLAFKGKGHSEKAHKMLQKYLIGQLVESERIYSR